MVSPKDAKVGRKTGGITGAMMRCYQLIFWSMLGGNIDGFMINCHQRMSGSEPEKACKTAGAIAVFIEGCHGHNWSFYWRIVRGKEGTPATALNQLSIDVQCAPSILQASNRFCPRLTLIEEFKLLDQRVFYFGYSELISLRTRPVSMWSHWPTGKKNILSYDNSIPKKMLLAP